MQPQNSLDEIQALVVVNLKCKIIWITFRNVTAFMNVFEKEYID